VRNTRCADRSAWHAPGAETRRFRIRRGPRGAVGQRGRRLRVRNVAPKARPIAMRIAAHGARLGTLVGSGTRVRSSAAPAAAPAAALTGCGSSIGVAAWSALDASTGAAAGDRGSDSTAAPAMRAPVPLVDTNAARTATTRARSRSRRRARRRAVRPVTSHQGSVPHPSVASQSGRVPDNPSPPPLCWAGSVGRSPVPLSSGATGL
jgi:hypothetical protein